MRRWAVQGGLGLLAQQVLPVGAPITLTAHSWVTHLAPLGAAHPLSLLSPAFPGKELGGGLVPGWAAVAGSKPIQVKSKVSSRSQGEGGLQSHSPVHAPTLGNPRARHLQDRPENREVRWALWKCWIGSSLRKEAEAGLLHNCGGASASCSVPYRLPQYACPWAQGQDMTLVSSHLW